MKKFNTNLVLSPTAWWLAVFSPQLSVRKMTWILSLRLSERIQRRTSRKIPSGERNDLPAENQPVFWSRLMQTTWPWWCLFDEGCTRRERCVIDEWRFWLLTRYVLILFFYLIWIFENVKKYWQNFSPDILTAFVTSWVELCKLWTQKFALLDSLSCQVKQVRSSANGFLYLPLQKFQQIGNI